MRTTPSSSSSSNDVAYLPLSPAGSTGASEVVEEAGQTELSLRVLLEEASLEAEPVPRRSGRRVGLLALWATLPVAAVVAWLSDAGRWLWFPHGQSRSDPAFTVVNAETGTWNFDQADADARLLPSSGRTSPWIPKKCKLPQSHPRCPDMEANVEYTFNDAGTMWTSHVRHVIGPEKCCAICQGTKQCKAWSWVKNSGPWKNWYVCFLKGSSPSGKKTTNGVISGRPPPRLPLKMQERVTGPRDVSLYCFSLMRPGSSEVDLIKAQEAQGASIFACNECMVYSNKAIQIGSMTTSVINSDLKCTSGGDFGKALNSWIFIEVWRKVIDDGRYYHHNWTVKADPDAVFFPSRLQTILEDHLEAGYINNCKEGMHGPIEVLSRKAVGALAWDYRSSKNGTYPMNCVAAQELSRWGEDMFLDKCLMDTLNIERVFDVRLLCEGSCGCPDWYWCLNGTSRATFHPFKSADTYINCLANALSGGAEPMPPAPVPCAEAMRQCGGKGWRGPTCCEKGHSCRENNTWYSQCEPDCAGPLAQCGGDDWKGVTCCKDDYLCVKKDRWYHQCRPPWAPAFPHDPEGDSTSESQNSDQDDGDKTTTGCAEANQQCGGRKYHGPQCCPGGYTCWRKNEWYSQCKENDSPEVTHSWGNNDADCVGPEQQCGGIGYDGARCCTAGYACTEKNHWYSECSVPGKPMSPAVNQA